MEGQTSGKTPLYWAAVVELCSVLEILLGRYVLGGEEDGFNECVD